MQKTKVWDPLVRLFHRLGILLPDGHVEPAARRARLARSAGATAAVALGAAATLVLGVLLGLPIRAPLEPAAVERAAREGRFSPAQRTAWESGDRPAKIHRE